ncbi:hypothetical protein INT80_04575 [Gallibacterium anatis]|uniref:Uncharacterized protein n=1 Tax=Gallibacterium anatis TaxID=750 RepID=A0A930UTI4_9PAST|nr:hypothetical protein [Gallibacterium anatis]
MNGHLPFKKLQQADLRFLKPFLGDNTQLNSRFNLDGEVSSIRINHLMPN